MSAVKEMIQIAFEYEVKIQQLSVELQKAGARIKELEAALASYAATPKKESLFTASPKVAKE
jgi:hypothetical protein